MKLQNNYTTPEQSKRLLELGLPADSADCYHNSIAGRPFTIPYGSLYSDPKHSFLGSDLPCWSVGRLIEILAISYGKPICWIDWCKEQPPIETILAEIEAGVCQNTLDFSKLED